MNKRMSESGQVLIAVLLLIGIIVVGMIIVADGAGVDILGKLSTVTSECVKITYASGLVETVCK